MRVAEAWLAQGQDVFALTRSRQRAAEFAARGIEPIVGDVTRRDSLDVLPAVDVTLYAVGFDRSTGHSMQEVYVDGLRNVLAKVTPGKGGFLYISSTSVYGRKKGEWVDESSACQPTRTRGRICLEAEHLVRSFFSQQASIDANGASILRLAGIYGPGRLLRRVDTLRSGAQLPGNPEAYLNLIHVQDAVQSICACEARGEFGETYLVCDNKPVRRRDYFETLAALMDAPAPNFAPAGDSSPADERSDKRCSNRKLREELGVSLRFPSYESGLPDAVASELNM